MFLSVVVFFFKQKTAYEMRISDWSSDVCSSDLSKYSLILYEMMSTLVRRKHRRDSWPVEELRNWLGVDRPEHPDVVTAENPEKLQGWNPFYKQIGRASGRERVCQYV